MPVFIEVREVSGNDALINLSQIKYAQPHKNGVEIHFTHGEGVVQTEYANFIKAVKEAVRYGS